MILVTTVSVFFAVAAMAFICAIFLLVPEDQW